MRKKVLTILFALPFFNMFQAFAAADPGGGGGGGIPGGGTSGDPLGGKSITVPGNPLFQPTADLSPTSGAAGGGTPITNLFSTILGFFTIVGGLLFLLYFVMGALTWLSSGGEKGKIEKARDQLVNSALGLVIMIISQAIVGIVGGVLGLDILNPVNALQGLFK